MLNFFSKKKPVKKPGNLGIIGNPVEHSLSPRMQNAALKKLKTGQTYTAYQVSSKELPTFIKKLKTDDSQNIDGLNVTVPHKEDVMKYLDSISSEAQQIGAVNTIIRHRNGKKLHGTNTDAHGFLEALKELKYQPKKKSVLVIGAGGASRAILYALAKSGAQTIYLTNRTREKAQDLCLEFSKKFKKTKFETVPFYPLFLSVPLKQATLIVNTTSVGLHGTTFKNFPLSQIQKNTFVVDLVYNPFPTPFLKTAKKQGAKIQSGLEMLLHQGAKSLELWTKKKPPLSLMRKALFSH